MLKREPSGASQTWSPCRSDSVTLGAATRCTSMRWAGLVLIVVLAACGPSSSTSSIPAPSPSQSPRATGEPELTCRLPAAIAINGNVTGGFVSFPGGDFTADRASTLVQRGADQFQAGGTPPGRRGLTYDRAFSQWLPVARNAVSPDGAKYVYTDGRLDSQKAHLVDVRTGAENVIALTGFQFVALVVEYRADGIYLASGYEGPALGLWLLDPVAGSYRQLPVTTRGIWDVDRGFSWTGVLVDPADSRGPSASDSVVRVDLKTGAKTSWFTRLGSSVYPIGFDQDGHPFVSVHAWDTYPGGSTEVWLATAPDSAKLIDSGSLQLGAPGQGEPVADLHGVWFAGSQGIYLLRPSGLLKVSNTIGIPLGVCV